MRMYETPLPARGIDVIRRTGIDTWAQLMLESGRAGYQGLFGADNDGRNIFNRGATR
jgi:hypothetical protein